MKKLFTLTCALLSVGALWATDIDPDKSYDKDKKSVPMKWNKKNTEWGITGGMMTYLGDLPSPKLFASGSKVFGGIMMRNHIHSNVAIRAFANIGSVMGDDALSDDLSLKYRNLHFRSNIWEVGAAAEYVLNITKKKDGDSKTFYKLAPFAMLGVNLFHFNPQAQYKGQWIDLKPLNTEGQSIANVNARSYKRTQVGVPLGVGLKYQMSSKVNIALELSYRKTFTDYIDDVSTAYPDMQELFAAEGQTAVDMSFRGNLVPGRENRKSTPGARRGNSDNNDWLMMTSISLRMKLGKEKEKK